MALQDPAAFRQFFDRTFDPAYRFAYALSGDAEIAEMAIASLYADGWLSWRRMPKSDDEVRELLDDLFAQGYEAFQQRNRLVSNADEIARVMAGTIQQRWQQTSNDFRSGQRTVPTGTRPKLLGNAEPRSDPDDPGELDEAAVAPTAVGPAGGTEGGLGEMANWRRVRW